jgi:hypothetical protein
MQMASFFFFLGRVGRGNLIKAYINYVYTSGSTMIRISFLYVYKMKCFEVVLPIQVLF